MHFPQDWSWTNSSEFYFHRALLNRRLLRKLAKHALSNFENIHCIAKSMRLKNFRQVSSSAGPISQCYFSHVLCLSLGGWTAISITHTYKDSLSIFPAHSLSPAQHIVRGPCKILTQQRSPSSYPSTALALCLPKVSLPSGFILPLVPHGVPCDYITNPSETKVADMREKENTTNKQNQAGQLFSSRLC